MTDVPHQLGNYSVIRQIGEGACGDVYLGKHRYLNSQVAIKVLKNISDQQNFLREAQTVAALKHPHILRVLDFGIEGTTPYLVMDYALYGSVRLQHPRNTVVPLGAVLSYTRQVAQALHYAHQQRIVHRDVKPENMLLGAQRNVLLSDFGIALAVSSRTQDVAGTIAYIAPEQIKGKPCPASDQYALAITVYEWLSGDVPFHGTMAEITAQHLKAQPPAPRIYAQTLSSEVEVVILRALEKEPEERFPTILAFADALTKSAGGVEPRHSTIDFVTERTAFKQRNREQANARTVAVEKPSVLHQSVHEPRRFPRRGVLLALTGLVGIGSIVGGYAFFSRLSPSSTPARTQAGIPTQISSVTPVSTQGITPVPTQGPPPGTLALSYRGHTAGVYSVAWSPDGKRIVSGGADQTAQVWDAMTGNLLTLYRGHSASVTYVAFDPSGTHIASASDDRTVQIWEAATDKTLLTCVGHSGDVHSAVWSPDGKWVASGSNDTTVRVWDANSGNLLMTYRGHSAPVWDVGFSPDGTRIASASGDNQLSDDHTVMVCNSVTGATELVYRGQNDRAIYVAFSPDGKWIASGSDDAFVRVWDASTGNTQTIYTGHDDTIYGVAWSPDGARVASGSVDKTAQVWDATTGNTEITYQGHSNTVYGLAWSPDGTRIASASEDKTVQVWQA